MESEFVNTTETTNIALKTFTLKKRTNKEIIASSIEDLSNLHTSIMTEKEFILAANGKAEVVHGSTLKNELSLGNITLKAEY